MSDSVVKLFTTHLKQALARAMQFAAEFGHKQVEEEHLLYGLAAEKGSISAELLNQVHFPVDLLKQDIIRRFHTPYFHEGVIPDLSEAAVIILTKAVRTAQLYAHPYVGTEHVLACLLDRAEKPLQKLLPLWNVNRAELQRRLLVVLKSTSKFPDLTHTLKSLQSPSDGTSPDQVEFPILESLGRELTTPEYLDTCTPLVGRAKELDRLQQILGRRHKNNPLLVGKAGVGKTAIVEGLARAILSEDAPPFLQDKRVFALELSSLVAGTMYRGDFEQRIKLLVEEIKDHPEVILFIDEIHTLVGAGSSGQPLDAANILKPALARGEIRCIGATTWDEYQKHMASDQALARRFQTVTVEEPNVQETRQIIAGAKESFERFHHVVISPDAIDATLELSERYLTHTCWPDKAIDLLDEAASRVVMHAPVDPKHAQKHALKLQITNLQKQKNALLAKDDYGAALDIHEQLEQALKELQSIVEKHPRRLRVTNKHIRDIVAVRTGIDVDRLHLAGKPITDELFAHLRSEIIGQDEALQHLCNAIQRGHSPLKDARKPIGAYLLLGPSGVGKTATAKATAKYLFGDEKALVRLDMSEYGERFTSSKLIGAPAGYVGYQQSGVLTQAVRQRPLSVVLFDEVEKAHPDIFNLLLQILDEGTLLDGAGQRVDFRHTVIMLTSNLGLETLQHRLGFDAGHDISQQTMQREFSQAAKNHFRQELLNRLDGIVHFKPLGVEARTAIIKKHIEDVQNRVMAHVALTANEEAVAHLAVHGYREEHGVRSLQQAVREQVEFPLSQKLSSFKKGSKVNLAVRDQTIVLE
ncbi:MAG: ATP-dependent Clp protease ATP-binding subunit [Parcubacteria group bacterium]|nr:ATP-dependent Clp protease ATP-binding subunit [Parcubacteria group bacterium]